MFACSEGSDNITSAPPAQSDVNAEHIVLPGQGDDAGKTVVYRDTYGIAHIYAPTVAAGLYAQGWAQAQDRPTQLLMNLKISLGELTQINGAAGVSTSLVSHMFGHLRNAKAAVAGMSDDEKNRMAAFANGITDYYKAHPEDVPAFWQYAEITPEMIDAFGRMFLYNWSIDEAMGDLRRGGIEPQFVSEQRASNQWAISPGRSASGHAMLLIDPHLSWWGVSRFWEMRVHAGDWHGSGVSLAGSPYIGLGHNADVAWAMTTGGPDTADVFKVQLHPEDANRYKYDDQWQDLDTQEVEFTFPDGSKHKYEWQATQHGPVIAKEDGYAYAAKIAYDSGTNRNSAWELLNFAKDYKGAMQACATLSMFPQNVMVADTSGNIYYQRTGRVPVRPAGYDWSRPVDGSSSKSQWQGIHPATDHLQVLNPPQGYMQNCNIPPDAMLPDSPFSLDAQPEYLFSSADHGAEFAGWTNQRGARAIELLQADTSVTIDEALAYAVDIEPYGYQRWLAALQRAQPTDSAALTELLAWDGQLDKTSKAALKYYYWRKNLDALDNAEQSEESEAQSLRSIIDDHYSVVKQVAPQNATLTAQQNALLRKAWDAALQEMADRGASSSAWGDVFRVGRDEQSWPVGGGLGDHLGLTSLRTVGFLEANEDNQRMGFRGQTSTQLVVLSKPIQSWIYLPVGQSDRPDSPHYTDQARTVFSERSLKPSWWLPQDLVGHVESRTVLTPR